MAAKVEKPHAGSTAEQLAVIEKTWTKLWYMDDRPWDDIHDSPWLEKYADKVTGGQENLRWFVPLCAKAPAMKWLADNGHLVIGVDLVGKSIEMFFDKYDIKYTKSDVPALKFGALYESEDGKIKIYKCNIFDVTKDLIGGEVNAVWDRGSLQDIDPDDRSRYGEILLSLLAPDGKILAETFLFGSGSDCKSCEHSGFDHEEEHGKDCRHGQDHGHCHDDGHGHGHSHDHGQEHEHRHRHDHGHEQGHGHDDGEEMHHCSSVSESDFEKMYAERCNIQVIDEEKWSWGPDGKLITEAVGDDRHSGMLNSVRLITFK